MPLEPFPQEKPFQIGVADEFDTEKVIDLSLLEIGTAPQADHRRHFTVLAAASNFDHDAVIVPHGGQDVDHLDVVKIVSASETGEVVEIEIGGFFEKLGHFKKDRGIDEDASLVRIDDGLRKMLAYLFSDVFTNKRLRHISKYLKTDSGDGAFHA